MTLEDALLWAKEEVTDDGKGKLLIALYQDSHTDQAENCRRCVYSGGSQRPERALSGAATASAKLASILQESQRAQKVAG